MFSSSRRQSRSPAIDLDTMRETLRYMHDDLARSPGYERLAASMAAVLKELETAGAKSESRVVEVHATRFVPFRR